MKRKVRYESNIELLVSKVNHSIVLIKQKELAQYHIAPRQLYILHIIHALGSNATASNIANEVDREVHVINRLAITLENDRLIKRTKKTPKSKLLHLELTKRGLDKIKISLKSKRIEAVLSFMPEEERQQMISSLNKILIKLKENILV